MDCCAAGNPIGQFFSGSAKRTAKRFRKKGLAKDQRRLMDCLQQTGFTGQSILEVGCGVGAFHLTMLGFGATRAIGVDLSEPMLAQARVLANELGHEEHTVYRSGDFAVVESEIEQADVTVLDKVVCCYPDAQRLIRLSIGKTRRTYALTYPRVNVLTRMAFTCAQVGLWLIRSKFRPYLYDPSDIERWISENGFTKAHEARGPFWLSQVYTHNGMRTATRQTGLS